MKNNLNAKITALLFAYGEAISLNKLKTLLELDDSQLKLALENLKIYLENTEDIGLNLRYVQDKVYLSTKEDLASTVELILDPELSPDLTRASYEVLAVIAYNKVVTRAQIEEVRGVNSDHAINRLLERGLIEVVGKAEVPGRPSLFSCTELFLKQMGLKDCDELPTLDLLMYDNIKRLEEEKEEA